ncbi:hypothetical protein J1N35_041553 [Gossypium stocksii]|uniref:Uncharacterized protein n=1 Tax=Gossypium stocksii TaxID=47602 RepID=A0A9D3UFV8_9ROSI|nr:hypothetical protein J1N35_041553 [Gossypium stocksii]
MKASQNKIMDEKSLIKKYQKEISSLKHELEQLRQGMMERPYTAATTQDDLVNLKLQLSGKWRTRVLGLPKMSLKLSRPQQFLIPKLQVQQMHIKLLLNL